MSGTKRDRRGGNRGTTGMRTTVGWAATTAGAALLVGCGGSSGSLGTPASTPPGGPAASAAPAAQAAGGSMGCLAGTWRTNAISLPGLKVTGGAGGLLTISGTGAFAVNYDGIQPMTFSYNGVKGSMQYIGQAHGQLRVSGDNLSGTTQSSSFKAKSEINGVSFELPLPKVATGATAPWVGFRCSASTLTLISPPPGGNWSMTRVS